MNSPANGDEARVEAALAWAQARRMDRLDAQHLLGHLLARPRTWLLTHGDHRLLPSQVLAWRDLVSRWLDDEPMGYLIGTQPFAGLDLQVAPGVLVPRADTQVLVDWALELLRDSPAHRQPPVVVDLGTGSGAIALAIKDGHPSAQVVAVEASPQALEMARANAHCLALAIDARLGHWWQAVTDLTVDLAVSNPPYIRCGDPHLAALRHEPLSALTAGEDGLDDIRAIIGGAPARLRRGAWLLLEHGFDQADAVRDLFLAAGFGQVSTRPDVAGRPRSTGGCWR